MTRCRGFTMIELLVVIIVLGVLATLALLKYIDLRDEAMTSQVAGDLQVVRVGAYNYWGEHEAWPNEVGAGQVPPELSTYLPGGFNFVRPTYTLDWEHLNSGDASPTIAVTISSPDTDFMDKLIRRLGNRAPFVAVGNTLTYVISGPEAAI